MPIDWPKRLSRWATLLNVTCVARQDAMATIAAVPPRRLPPERDNLKRLVPRRRLWRRRGFTLLEVILALAILAGALAALGEVVRSATENASEARELTRAQLLAVSVMSEAVANPSELSAVNRQTANIDGDEPWVYSVELLPTLEENLLAVQVVVSQDLSPAQSPVQYRLVRWIRDPSLLPLESGSSDSSSSSSSGSSSAGSGSSGSAGSGSGGSPGSGPSGGGRGGA